MGKLLAYLIVVGMTMLAMYLVYKLFMARDSRHGFNRGILLAVYAVSFGAWPVFDFFVKLGSKPVLPTDTGVVAVDRVAVETAARTGCGTVLIWIFMLGACVVALRTVMTWIRIVRVVRFGQKFKKDGYVLVVTVNDRIAPFSWMRYVVINQADFDSRNTAVIAHELKHVRSGHWLDLLVAQAVCIVNWFNPAAWLMRDELMLVHEYQADMAVIAGGHNPQEYQMLLIKKAVGSRFPSLANSMNHSKLKKRITMMYKAKSCAGSRLKALALVPAVALALGVTAVPAVKATVSTIGDSALSRDKGNENLPKSARFKIVSLNDSGIETTVVIDGEGVGDYLSVSDVSFANKGRKHGAKSVKTTMTDGRAVITAVFPFSDSYENASVALAVNGNEVRLGLDDFRRNSQTSSVSVSPSDGIVISQGNATVSDLSDMEIYLDGKKISEDEMRALNPETIASVSIDRQNKTIAITCK